MSDLLKFLDAIEQALGELPSDDELRTIRNRLQSTAFRLEFAELFRKTNDPDVRAQGIDTCSRIIATLEERASALREEQEQLRVYGVGGGIGMATGGAIAVGLVVPLAAIFPVAGGCWVVWRSARNGRKLARRVTLLQQVRGAILELRDKHRE